MKTDCQNRIRVVLADKQITNRWLARQMGVTDMTVSRWKTNKIQPSIAQFVEIARLLQVDIKDLLDVDFGEEKKIVPDIDTMAKELADEMTNVNIQSKNLQGEVSITKEYVDNNAAVRKMLTERGIIPENLPPAEDVKKVERRLASEQKVLLKNKKK
jgi:transcriptional regulator with XRE-family HTH domain